MISENAIAHKQDFIFPDKFNIPENYIIEFMIDTLAESHSTSKRIIENEYSRYDYFIFVTRKNLESVKEKFKYDTQNPKK